MEDLAQFAEPGQMEQLDQLQQQIQEYIRQMAEQQGIEEGKPANFLVLDAPSAFEALRLVPARLHVFKGGREVASTIPGKSVLRRSRDDEGKEVTFRL